MKSTKGSYKRSEGIVNRAPSRPEDPNKILSSTGKLSPLIESFAQQLSESNDSFGVFAVIGKQGTGKSSLANALLGVQQRQTRVAAEDSHNILARGNIPSDPSVAGRPDQGLQGHLKGNNMSLQSSMYSTSESDGFATRWSRSLSWPAGLHCTNGIDMRVSPLDRTIVIDTQPLCSASALAKRQEAGVVDIGSQGSILADLEGESQQKGLGSLPLAAVQHLFEIQLVTFLLATCHVVIVMIDAEEQAGVSREVWNLLQAAEMMVPTIPDISASFSSSTPPSAGLVASRTAEVVFVFNHKCSTNEPMYGELLTQQHMLASLFSDSKLLVAPGERLISVLDEENMQERGRSSQKLPTRTMERTAAPSPKDSLNKNGECNVGGRVHIWALPSPELYLKEAGISVDTTTKSERFRDNGAPTDGGAWAGALVNRLMQHPRRYFARSNMSEKEWLKGCQRAWTALQCTLDMKELFHGLLQSVYDHQI
ncbi:hypothetical protein CEUSTIGMA_g157.t1 [Chlamydomonas eustigma]|uniref:Protein SMG9 n=1 Tax=Chlamydomonas eustigma TaxID=1157962 RepID=A0A250WPI7_9CHLO|nr:hypothetical protein CEUSTIGMA_g157.t1 [Chlamydomonas eustigma]|eukprot:GAX72701.1 hypothetical protein CEUSTIGMA_g157.t1 [Chlamydomonas eustigma]